MRDNVLLLPNRYGEKMLKISSAIAVLSLCSFAGFSLGGIFYNEAQFLESVQVEYANTFDDVVQGTTSSMEFSQGEFSYTITAAGPGGGILNGRDGAEHNRLS